MTIEIKDANIKALLAEGTPLVVDCWAPWCGPCRMLGPVIEELANEYDGQVRVGKLNVDENELIPQEYGIMSIPTVLYFKNGELVNRTVGALPKAQLKQAIDQLL